MTGRRWLGLASMGVGAVLVAVAIAGMLGPGDGPVAEASPSASVSESQPTPSPTPEPTPTPLPSLGAADVEAFIPRIVAAIQTGDVETMVANLHPATIERYGEEACRTQVATFTNPDFDIEVLDVLEQAPWDYVTDELTTTIPDAWEVPGNLTVSPDIPPARQSFHFAPFEGEVRWFTDCGTPL